VESSEVLENYEKLMNRIKTEHSEYIAIIDDTQKKVEQIKKHPIILTKRRYYIKDTAMSNSV